MPLDIPASFVGSAPPAVLPASQTAIVPQILELWQAGWATVSPGCPTHWPETQPVTAALGGFQSPESNCDPHKGMAKLPCLACCFPCCPPHCTAGLASWPPGLCDLGSPMCKVSGAERSLLLHPYPLNFQVPGPCRVLVSQRDQKGRTDMCREGSLCDQGTEKEGEVRAGTQSWCSKPGVRQDWSYCSFSPPGVST